MQKEPATSVSLVQASIMAKVNASVSEDDENYTTFNVVPRMSRVSW